MLFRILALFALLPFLAATQVKPAPEPKDPDDPGPPVVKRGPNAPRKGTVSPAKGPNIITPKGTSDEEPESAPPPSVRRTPQSEPAPAEDPEDEGRVSRPATRPKIDLSGSLPPKRNWDSNDPLILRAAEAAVEFDATLPNFICDEIVSRFMSKEKPAKWKKEDKVEVEVLYVDRKEDYRNVRINGKPLKSGTPEDSGSWSSGDWGTTLMDVLHPSTDAAFIKRGNDKIAGIDVDVFDYVVEKPNSHWNVRYGKTIKPAYKGALYIDPKTARVLRIEMQARKIPTDYELDAVEMMVQYGWVTIKGEKFLLPTNSENLACWRYTTRCSRNELEFKNYRKFSAESSISTTESDISFDDKEAKKPEAPAPPVTKKK